MIIESFFLQGKHLICETDLSGVETIAQVSEIPSGESIITLSDCE